MKLRKSFRLALNILLHSKLRSWLTIIGTVIGVASIVAIVSIGEGAQASVNERLSGLGADIITVSPGFSRASGNFRGFGGGGTTTVAGTKNLTDKDVRIIKATDGVLFANGIVSGRVETSYLAETATLSIQGVDPFPWQNILTTELGSGRLLEPGDSGAVVIGNRIATSTFKQPIGINRDIIIDGKSFKVVGILKSTGTGGDDNAVFMTATDAREVLDNKGQTRVDSIVIKASSPDEVDAVSAALEQRLLISRHVTNRTRDFSITSSKATQERLASVTQTFTLFLGAIAAVSLLVGAVGIANTMFTSVLEKTKEIGIMKALGATNGDIMTIFLLNSGLVGFTGGLLGIMLGAATSYVLPNVLSGIGPGGAVKTVLPAYLLIGALLLSVAIGMIAGAIPAYRASKLKPVDALRYE